MKLSVSELLIMFENTNFANYNSFMEETIEKEKLQLEQSYEDYIMKYPKEVHDRIFEDQFEDDFHNFRDVFPKILRTSALIAQYAYFEKTLNKISNDCQEKFNLTIKPKDIRHNGVKKYIFYLKHVVGLRINDGESLWRKIEVYNQLRNHFVHSPEDEFSLKEKLKLEQNVKGLKFKKDALDPEIFDLIRIEKEMNEDFFELYTEALKYIISELKIKNQEL
ncbi:hypothetical protein CW357_01130 [Rummeliibacillus sp. TYF005]|uniref:hypothetical protein n=1 Tax=Rummeliibacillus sp. TYF005 TaxID=2058214 RepID=UPI000F51F0DB|nr:hypothetical protein [Rummeliibacillus sp. TYF005]RPJ97299.1 hypothetical protein CW357_01130 [Rummeliibacillus sp. TYF005]